MRILHIVRELHDVRALETARAHAARHEVSLLLLHDAVLDEVAFPGPVYACRDDLVARGRRQAYQAVDYDEIVRLICGHERVISW